MSVLPLADLRGLFLMSVLPLADLRGRFLMSVLPLADLRGRFLMSVLPLAALRGRFMMSVLPLAVLRGLFLMSVLPLADLRGLFLMSVLPLADLRGCFRRPFFEVTALPLPRRVFSDAKITKKLPFHHAFRRKSAPFAPILCFFTQKRHLIGRKCVPFSRNSAARLPSHVWEGRAAGKVLSPHPSISRPSASPRAAFSVVRKNHREAAAEPPASASRPFLPSRSCLALSISGHPTVR